MNSAISLIIVALTLFQPFTSDSLAVAQLPERGDRDEQAERNVVPKEENEPMDAQPVQDDLPQNMDKMATTVTRMSEVCEQMMKHEMAAVPYKIAAAIGLGTLITIVLLLLAVLEVQWIIYWSRLLKGQKRVG